MPALLVRHKVRNFARWRSRFAMHEPTRQADGAVGERIFRNANDPEEVIVLLDWDDLDRAKLFAHSDDLRETMAYREITDRLDLWYLQEEDSTPD